MSVGHLYFLFGEVSVQVLCPLFNWIVCLLVLSSVSPLYILEISPLSEVSLVNMFSHSMGSLFISLMVPFAVSKLFSLM